MVIDQNDAGDRFQQRPALDLTGPVRVDYDEKTAVVRLDQRVLPGNKQIGIVRNGPELRNQALAGVLLKVNYDFARQPLIRHRQRRPTAAPSASRSAIRCPIIYTVLDWLISSDRELAIRRERMRVRRSVSLTLLP